VTPPSPPPPPTHTHTRTHTHKYAEAAEALSAGFVSFTVTIQEEIGPAAAVLLESPEDRAGKLLNLDCKLLLTLTTQRAAARAQTWARPRYFANQWRGKSRWVIDSRP
jgi:hypothetical protein